MDKLKLKIGAKLISIVTLLVILPIAILGINYYRVTSKIILEDYDELSKSIESSTAQILNDNIDHLEKSLDYVSESQLTINSLENVDESALRDMLKNLMKEYEVVSMYFVNTKGDIYAETDKGSASESINPLDKSWYTGAIESEGVFWTDAYDSETLGEKVITASKAVYNGTELVGVAGMDLSFENISNIITNIEIMENGNIAIADGNGLTIGSQDRGWLGDPLQPMDEIANLNSGTKKLDTVYEDKERGIRQAQLLTLKFIEKTGWKLFIVLPKTNIENTKSLVIKNIVTIVTISGLIGVFVSVALGKYISGSVRKVSGVLKKVEEGDFTGRIDIKSNDEFGEVRDSLNNTLETLGGLINNIKTASYVVGEQSGNLAALSEEVSASSLEISTTSEQIARGATDQAMDTERAVTLVNELAIQLEGLDQISEEMQSFIGDIKDTNESSSLVLNELRNKTEINNSSTNEVESEIIKLDERIGNISAILSTIDDIAEQTNLLALNASIEAARAGEYGKGFAVVAEEIRKLASESKESSSDIKNIIDSVQLESKQTVEVVKNVKGINKDQTEAVARVSEAFKTLDDLVQNIVGKIDTIWEHSKDMNENRNDIVSTIQNISAVSQETAAASEEVTASIQQQTAATDDVANSAGSLNELAEKLNIDIDIFKV